MFTQPKITAREEQHYVGIRSQIPVSELPTAIREGIDGVYDWLGQHGMTPPPLPPFIRYYVINMETKLDIEIGVPVASALSGDERVKPGVLPAGQYASLVYTGVENGREGNAKLLEWGAEQGLKWDQWDSDAGDAFGSRVEFFLTGPEDDPNPSNWDSEVAIKLADQ